MNHRLLLAAVLLSFSLPARAIHLSVDDADVRKGDYTVEKGATYEGDLAAKGAVTVKGVVTGDCASFGGPLVIDGECRGEASSFGGPLRISGKVGRDVASFGGSVDLSGVAGRDVAVFGGDLDLRDSADVEGGVSIFGGRLNQESGAKIKGETHNFNSRIMSALVPSIAFAAVRHADRHEWRDKSEHKALISGSLVALCVLPFLLALFFPRHVETVAAAAASDYWRAAGIGLLIEMATLPATVALCVSVIGIAFIPAAYALLAAGAVLGTGAFFVLMTRRACRNMGKPEPGTIAAVGCAGAATAAISILGGLVPLGGLLGLALFMTLCCGMTLGLGAAWITRLGTRPAPAA
ncbi:MAG: hypothetical protein ACHQ49_11200 [Elusimicrobiota bacterium]